VCTVLKRYFSPGLPIHFKGENSTIELGSHMAMLDCAVTCSCWFVHVIRVASGLLEPQGSLYAL